MSAVLLPSDSDKTNIMEGRHMFDASRCMLASSNDEFLEFLAKKLESIKGNDDAQARTVMVQKDRWLSAIFARFHREASGFCTHDTPPLYVTRAAQFTRVECEMCGAFFCCSRNFKGRHLMCVPCEDKTTSKKRKLDAQAELPSGSKRIAVVVSSANNIGSSSSSEEDSE